MSTPQTIVRGDASSQLQRQIFDFDPTRGWNVISEYEGASQTILSALAQQYAAAGIACRLILEKDKGSIEAHDATQQYTLDTWQIVGNDESRDVLSHPTVLRICSDDQVAYIRYSINSLDTTKPVAGQIAKIFTDPGWIAPTLSAPDQATMARFVGLVLRGSTDYRHAQYVLRHTTNAPNRWPSGSQGNWPANIAIRNVERLYTTSQLISEVVNAQWILPLPGEMQYTIQQITSVAPIGVQPNITPTGYLWSWLKSPSSTTTAANNRVEIATEYTLELWSTDDYEIAT